MKKLFLAAFCLMFGTVAAYAEDGQKMLCNKRAKVMENLASNYSEAPTAIGMAENGGVVEVLTSNDSSTWTILITMPDGNSCLVAMGNSWEAIKKVATGPQA